ncbi:hypothetical protein BDF20DRAFT_839766 [Mycotypha africana]|uniref:uncharacterized protein n=1 Tax=Mycotypha africana TaxID=64632 RepID=UPI0023002F6A|nr:uncharacterized protein BDF20DRAFT_839766 [Mycotypha africana]KAI8967930.1 hypothetical protein BDF20DRAFT_839766 [Mycotypha africana]
MAVYAAIWKLSSISCCLIYFTEYSQPPTRRSSKIIPIFRRGTAQTTLDFLYATPTLGQHLLDLRVLLGLSFLVVKEREKLPYRLKLPFDTVCIVFELNYNKLPIQKLKVETCQGNNWARLTTGTHAVPSGSSAVLHVVSKKPPPKPETDTVAEKKRKDNSGKKRSVAEINDDKEIQKDDTRAIDSYELNLAASFPLIMFYSLPVFDRQIILETYYRIRTTHRTLPALQHSTSHSLQVIHD